MMLDELERLGISEELVVKVFAEELLPVKNVLLEDEMPADEISVTADELIPKSTDDE